MYRLLAALAFATLPAFAAPAPEDKVKAKTDLARLAGIWEVTSYLKEGKEVVGDKPTLVITFKADGSYAFEAGPKGKVQVIDPTKKPKEIDYVQTDEDGDPITDSDGKLLIQKGIYKLDGDTFSDCFAKAGDKARPTEFKSTKENGWTVMVYKRMKEKN